MVVVTEEKKKRGVARIGRTLMVERGAKRPPQMFFLVPRTVGLYDRHMFDPRDAMMSYLLKVGQR